MQCVCVCVCMCVCSENVMIIYFAEQALLKGFLFAM
jgi:hypothetical protein